MRSRLAPSPTGALHLGNARTFLLNWLLVRAAGGTLAVRVEDLDGPRVKAGAGEQALEDLVGSTLTAIARFGQKRGAGGESAGQPMPPLPEAPEDRLLHGIVVSVEDPQQRHARRNQRIGRSPDFFVTLEQ